MVNAYATVQDVKWTLGITSSDDDVRILTIIEGVSRYFDLYVGEPLTQVTRNEQHDGGVLTERGLVLGFMPDAEANSLAAFRAWEDGVELVRHEDFQIDVPAQIVYRLEGGQTDDPTQRGSVIAWAPGQRNVEFEYLTRFSPGFGAADIEMACREESARHYLAANTEAGDGNRIGITQRTPESGTTISYAPSEIAADTMRVLNQYRSNRFV